MTDMVDQASETSESFSIRPNFTQKFRPAVVSKLLHQVLIEHLQNKSYDPEIASQLTKDISEAIKSKLRELDLT
ncbi:hypothetical protein K7432_014594, partial [Basidiobolus ranarum]